MAFNIILLGLVVVCGVVVYLDRKRIARLQKDLDQAEKTRTAVYVVKKHDKTNTN